MIAREKRRVVITGVGCVTQLGIGVENLWGNLKESKSGVGYTTIFDASNFPTRISAEVKDWDVTEIGEDAERWKHRGRHSRFAAGAARKAVDDSGIESLGLDPTRFGIDLGSGEGQHPG